MMRTIKRLLRRLKSPKIRERNKIRFGIAGWVLNAIFYGTMAFFIIAALFLASILFMQKLHNIDLAVNFANIGCDSCLKDIVDEGTAWSGKHVNLTLKDSYIDSLHDTTLLFYYSNMGSFLAGIFIAVFVISIILAMSFHEKYKDWKRRWQK